jgi:uncharacterized protein (TIRG00374 family)
MMALARWWAKPVVRWGVGVAIGALSLYLALRNISWKEVWQAFQQADWGYMGLALVSVAVGVYAKVIRWQVLLGESGRRIKLSRLVMAHLAGQSLNLIYPARAGDISRVYVIGAMGISRMFLLGTIVLEKLWDMFSYTLVFLLLLLLIPLPGWVSNSAYSVAAVTLIFFLASFVLAYQRAWIVSLAERLIGWLPEKTREQFLERIHAGLTSLEVLQSRKELFWLAFWSTMVWVTAVLNNHLVLLAMRIHLPVTASVLILVALQAGISLPTAPGRLGIFQYICVLTLGIYGIGQALAFSYSVLLHSVALLTILLSGLVCVWILGLSDPKHTPRKSTLG